MLKSFSRGVTLEYSHKYNSADSFHQICNRAIQLEAVNCKPINGLMEVLPK